MKKETREAAAVVALTNFLGELLTGALKIDKNGDGKVQFWSEALPFGAKVTGMAAGLIPQIPSLPDEIKHITREQIESIAANFALSFNAENENLEAFIEELVKAVTHILLAAKALKK